MGARHTWSDQVLPPSPPPLSGDTGIVDLALQISNQGILKMSGPYIVRNNEGTTSLSFKSTAGRGWRESGELTQFSEEATQCLSILSKSVIENIDRKQWELNGHCRFEQQKEEG